MALAFSVVHTVAPDYLWSVSWLSRSPADGGRREARVSQPEGLGRRAPEVAAGAGGPRCLPAEQRPGAGGGGVMFPFGPGSPGGDREAGTEEPAPHGEETATAGPLPSPPALPLPGADAAPPPSPARSPRRPGGPSLPQASRAAELRSPAAPRSPAASSQGEPSPPSPTRRRPGPDCKAWSREPHALGAGLGGPGARLFGWLRERSLGRGLFVDPARDNFRTMTNLYGSIHPADSVYLSSRTHGAVFNLEYSPDG